LSNNDCKDCEYVKNLKENIVDLKQRVNKLEDTVIEISKENAETKVYYENILNLLDSLNKKIEKLETALEQQKINMFTKFKDAPWSLQLLIYILGALAGLRLIGIDISTFIK
jgi:chromosome segregation ATPase